jgi:uncharacterized spore protein YtfJ
MESKLNNNLEVLLGQLEHFITTKTVVGEPIHIGETILLPLVDVSFGVAAGAAAANNVKEKNKGKERSVDGQSDTGAGGLGAKITPSAMLVIQNGTTQLINIKGQDSISKLIDMVPGFVSNFPDVLSKFTEKDKKEKSKVAKEGKKESQTEDFEI